MADTNAVVKRLSTRDKKLREAANMSPDILARDMMLDQEDWNIRELKQAIEKMPEGATKKGLNRKELLKNELLNIQNSMAPIDLGINTMNQSKPQEEKSPIDQVLDFLTNMWSKK